MPDAYTILCDYLPLLRLEEWRVSICFAHQHELEKPNRLAELEWSWNTRTAMIRVVQEQEATPSFSGEPYDLELLIAHELVHLRLVSTLEQEPPKGHEEWEIEALARALVQLRRRAA